jgi:STE24 endopeptidase
VPRLVVLIPLIAWLTAPVGDAGSWTDAALLWLGCLAFAALAWAAGMVQGRRFGSGLMPPAWVRWAVRVAVPGLFGWFLLGTHTLSWPAVVQEQTGDAHGTLGLLLGALPAYLAWSLVVAAQWPVVRRLQWRPVQTGFARWWIGELRPTLLVTLAPLLVFWVIRDLVKLGLDWSDLPITGDAAALLLTAVALLASLTLGPPVIRRVLPTRPIPDDDGPGGRLHDLVRRGHLRRSTGLLHAWQTGNSIINALAVGIVPRLRYILLSDLLLRSLPVWQVEAVLAHEIGHMRHRHVLWFITFFASASLFTIGPVDLVYRTVLPETSFLDLPISVLVLLTILFGFILLSRLFERQADVFAATLIGDATHVTGTGAWAFGEALRNAVGITREAPTPPLTLKVRTRDTLRRPGDWLHGSPQSRCQYLEAIADRPEAWASFQRRVCVIKTTIVLVGALSLLVLVI